MLLPLALRRVNNYQEYLYNNYSTTGGKSLRWLQIFLVLVLLLTGLALISFVQYALAYWEASESTFEFVTISLVIMLFWIGYFVIINHSWFEIAPMKMEEEKSSNKHKLSSNTANYYHKLLALIQEQRAYEDVNLTLDKLSERLQISSGYLSQIIKQHEQKNFFEFINNFRVEAVKQKLLDEAYQHYTIMGIANDCGFSSKSTFNSVFKKFTGETPSAFQQRHERK